ncbi:MAG: class I SAM-dependent methyltransferase [Candidatus Omnitrophica bacterium]|nr:class I SAM-dependent methyltransferase [Candidatus Omnitrophota bacterium]
MSSQSKIESRIIPEETGRNLYMQHLKVYEFLNQNAKNRQILEIGCGDGYGAAFLAKTARSIVAVDYEDQVIFTAQNKYKANNLQYRCMDATRLGFKENEFDLVCSFQVIEHIPEDKLLVYLNELNRVLKPNGELYLSTLNLGKVMKNPQTYKKNPAHCKEFVAEDLKAILSKVFDNYVIYGLHPSLKHQFYLVLKKSGIFKSFPFFLNPVERFYKNLTTDDFKLTASNLNKASDFVCVCKKNA